MLYWYGEERGYLKVHFTAAHILLVLYTFGGFAVDFGVYEVGIEYR